MKNIPLIFSVTYFKTSAHWPVSLGFLTQPLHNYHSSNISGCRGFINHFILAEPPSFLNAPEAVTKAAVGMDAMISCRVFGAPEPVVTWTSVTQNNTEIDNFRFETLENGTLFIKVYIAGAKAKRTRKSTTDIAAATFYLCDAFSSLLLFLIL